MEIKVALEKDSYSIIIEQGLINNLKAYVSDIFKGQKIMIISDDHVFPLYGEKVKEQLKDYQVNEIVIPHGETSKRFDILPSLYTQLLNYHITRTDLIIALGGGVIGDLAGFTAATYLRGVALIQIPTSLLAQVDSSVGGKTGVDLAQGKNLVGAFKHPMLVLIDPLTLKTLDPHFIKDGMGEVIKYGCIKDKHLFHQLLSYSSFDDLYQDIDSIIYQCINIKREAVEKDLFDFGDRLMLNFGHTIGHAIEQCYHYEKYSHGEAVSIGMCAMTAISEEMNLTKKGTLEKIKACLNLYGLPVTAHLSPNDLIKAISLDKKNIHNTFSFVLLKEIGESFIYKHNYNLILSLEEV